MVESLSVPTSMVGYPVVIVALYEKIRSCFNHPSFNLELFWIGLCGCGSVYTSKFSWILYQLSKKWKELVEKARAKQLQPCQYNSGTFTLSNSGMYGVDRFSAVLPPGQVTNAGLMFYLEI
ncbi:hypothetical protein Nepgr_003722 [Nepenthes gracilis]|uniref:2-oxoacid dehydrogenase acyltransferase catalytic domain-containing protein n=1 Tax=Nepenthes gracilis TaxID=150966 RepID=A0AAD3S020_NEPGR|nr:hypothetical protein Nepgr_003722 [Nepenthes gracilis]